VNTEAELNPDRSLASEEIGAGRQIGRSAAKTPEAEAAAPAAGAPSSSMADAVDAPKEAQAKDFSAGEIRRYGPDSASAIVDAPSEAPDDHRLGDALAALDRKDYATARVLFEALGRSDAAEAIGDALVALDRKDYATAQGLFEAFAPPRPPKTAPGPTPAPNAAVEQAPALSPVAAVPAVDAPYRQAARQAEKPKRRRLRPLLLGAVLTMLGILGASALYGSRPNWTFAAAKGQAIETVASTGGLIASASDLVTARLAAFMGSGQRKEERPAKPDLAAVLTQLTVRLDRMEHDYGTRLDGLDQRIDKDSKSNVAGVGARLDVLERKSAAPAQPAPELNDVVARLDKLERKVAAATASSSELADVAKRLSSLEKRTASLAAGSDRPLPPPAPKRSAKVAKAERSASNEILPPDSSRPLLSDYSLEGIRDGLAMVDGRYGMLQVGPGDFIPGAGRVLRIERRRGDWVVLTSRGVIASGPGPD
jgi:phosphoglycolate phosphatase-like HAD superfamily hydrolase